MDVQDFSATIFRKSAVQITIDGGLLDESRGIYGSLACAKYKATPVPTWTFNGRAKVSFRHIDGDRDLPKWQGAQICLIGFDELTHFSEGQFFYMLSRNRSACGVKPYVRATCNPDVDSWVASFISWWIDQDTGYPIPERSGVVRYFYRVEGEIHWGDRREELAEEFKVAPELCKSVTFIAASIHDNKELLKVNPDYLASLNALPTVERERLLNGNWKIKPAAGLYFPWNKAKVVEKPPCKIISLARAWDLAATEITTGNKSPDRTVGVLCGRLKDGRFIFLDVKRRAYNPAQVRELIRGTAEEDREQWKCNRILIPQDPGQAGKEQAISYVRALAGFNIQTKSVSGNKITRAEPLSAQWQAGNVLILKGGWNDEFLSELEGFPEVLHDDQVDAAGDAFKAVAGRADWSGLIS